MPYGSARSCANYHAVNLRRQIFNHGKLVYENPSIDEIKKYCAEQVSTLWDEKIGRAHV